jgi:hypothetical protein
MNNKTIKIKKKRSPLRSLNDGMPIDMVDGGC